MGAIDRAVARARPVTAPITALIASSRIETAGSSLYRDFCSSIVSPLNYPSRRDRGDNCVIVVTLVVSCLMKRRYPRERRYAYGQANKWNTNKNKTTTISSLVVSFLFPTGYLVPYRTKVRSFLVLRDGTIQRRIVTRFVLDRDKGMQEQVTVRTGLLSAKTFSARFTVKL